MEPDHLFVYGSLRQGVPAARRPEEAKAAFSALKRYAVRIGHASMQGRLYDIDWYPGMVSSRSRNERVVGDLFRLTDWGSLAPVLDAYEESASRNAARRLEAEYVRDRRRARLDEGGAVDAWVYLFDEPVEGLIPIEGGDYVAYAKARSKAEAGS